MPTDIEPVRPQQGQNAPEFSVSELANAIKRAIEDGFGYVRLRGEISGYRGPHASGHAYFALKDEKSKIEAVIWRGVFSKLRFKPEEGMEVVAEGRVTTYPNSSKYQIVIDKLEPAGVGALMALLDERKKKLAAEGLFAAERKRALPFLPRVIGIVTSPTGAVIRDMLAGFTERFPSHVIVWPARVQGEGSAAEIANGIRGFNALARGGPVPRPDVLIVARGGGSLEDLWSFNEEIVVRAAAASEIPLISAVGHETDWTLIDLVADARAPTPTKAAEWAVPKYSELAETTLKLGLRRDVALRRVMEGLRSHWRAAARGLPRREDLLALPRQKFDAVERRLGRGLVLNTRAHHLRHVRIASRLGLRLIADRMERTRDRLENISRRAVEGLSRSAGQRRTRLERSGARLSPTSLLLRVRQSSERADALRVRAARALRQLTTERRRQVDGLAKLAQSLSHQSVLDRGFALVRDEAGNMIRRSSAIHAGMVLDIEFADGRVGATAGSPHPDRGGPASRQAGQGGQLPAEGRGPEAGAATAHPPRPARRHRDTGQGNLF